MEEYFVARRQRPRLGHSVKMAAKGAAGGRITNLHAPACVPVKYCGSRQNTPMIQHCHPVDCTRFQASSILQYDFPLFET